MRNAIAAILLSSSLAMPVVFAEDVTPRSQLENAAKPVAEQAMPIRASQFIGMNIYNNDNASVGEVKDIVFDGGHNQISYVAVSYGGLLGIGDKLFAVPYQALKYRPVDKGSLTLDINKETVKNMQGFDEKNWPDLSDPTVRKQTLELYHVNPNQIDRTLSPTQDRAAATDARPNNAPKPDNHSVNPTGIHDHNAPMKDGLTWNRRYSELKGANIVNGSDQKLGDVYDVVFDAQNGRVSYVVLQRGGVMGIGDKLFAIPADALSSKQSEQKLVLDISVDRFKNAPGFDQSKWPDFADASLRSTYDQFYTPNQTSATDQK